MLEVTWTVRDKGQLQILQSSPSWKEPDWGLWPPRVPCFLGMSVQCGPWVRGPGGGTSLLRGQTERRTKKAEPSVNFS